jgi:hypothetical protein
MTLAPQTQLGLGAVWFGPGSQDIQHQLNPELDLPENARTGPEPDQT